MLLGQRQQKKGSQSEKMSKTNKKSISFKWKWNLGEMIICSQSSSFFAAQFNLLNIYVKSRERFFQRKDKDKVINCQSTRNEGSLSSG